LIAGSLLGLTGLTAGLFLAAAEKLLLLALMSFCCAVLVAWIAVETRGYFAPLGFAIFTLVLANVFGTPAGVRGFHGSSSACTQAPRDRRSPLAGGALPSSP
jgi:uncharacterized membrane protein